MPGRIRKPSKLYRARAVNKAPAARINPLGMSDAIYVEQECLGVWHGISVPKHRASWEKYYSCRMRVFNGGCWSWEGKSAPGVMICQSRTGRPAFSAQRSTCSRQSSMLTFAKLLQQINTPLSAVVSSAGFNKL